MYVFFKKEGVKIFSIDELEKNTSLINEVISPEDLILNRSVLIKHWSRDVVQIKTRKLIKQFGINRCL